MTEKDDRQLPEKEDLGEKPETADARQQRRHRGECSAAKSWPASLLFAAAVAAALALLTLDPSSPMKAGLTQGGQVVAGAGRSPLAGDGRAPWAWVGFTAAIAFLVMKTGRVSRWRAVFLVVMAWAFVVRFKAQAVGLKAGAFMTEPTQEVPYCHVALSSTILNAAYNQYLALKSGAWRQWGPLSLGFLWLVFTLALGQAWCSWVCYFGGLDEGFSRLLGRFRLRRFSLPPAVRDLPAGVLIFFAVISMTSLTPMFCLWACPIKLTTSFLDPVDAVRKAQTVILVVMAAGTLVLGPLITGKRVFCGLVCPFGAWQSLWGQVNPFRVTLDKESCTRCRLCVWACPTMAIEHGGPGHPRIIPYCNRCGECVDVCPEGAISFTLLGLPSGGQVVAGAGRSPLAELWEVRSLLVFCGLVLGGAVGGVFVPDALRTLAKALLR
ncbi:MAG: 4Fe-4S binding protein [Elusimicrobia bacterium]|nr:4Fe-4S binding protein [Elusimicrobiota bacterium]